MSDWHLQEKRMESRLLSWKHHALYCVFMCGVQTAVEKSAVHN